MNFWIKKKSIAFFENYMVLGLGISEKILGTFVYLLFVLIFVMELVIFGVRVFLCNPYWGP